MEPLPNAAAYRARINAYFKYIEGEFHMETVPAAGSKDALKVTEIKVWDRPPEPATFNGLALYLGFPSREQFDKYDQVGKCRGTLRQARLRIEAEYEKRLLQPSPTGAIFALKSMGWADQPENKEKNNVANEMRVVIVESGPVIANNEKDVVM